MTFVHRAIGHLPMMLHPEARDALVIGLGGGATAGAVSIHDGVDVDAVELAGSVARGARFLDSINYNVLTPAERAPSHRRRPEFHAAVTPQVRRGDRGCHPADFRGSRKPVFSGILPDRQERAEAGRHGRAVGGRDGSGVQPDRPDVPERLPEYDGLERRRRADRHRRAAASEPAGLRVEASGARTRAGRERPRGGQLRQARDGSIPPGPKSSASSSAPARCSPTTVRWSNTS